jgi:DNA polymerase-3 subunit epsilon
LTNEPINDQLGFAFLPDLPVSDATPRKKAPKPKSPGAAAPTAVAPTLAMETEAMARLLEAHPDYRLQRRLLPRLQWPVQASASVTRVVVLDTETTGLDSSKDAIIELALLCVDIDNATGLPVGEVQVYDGLEDPGRPIPKEVVALTGLTDDDVRGQKIDEARVLELLKDADLVIAHNAGFDRPFAEQRMRRFAELPWGCSFADIDWKAQGRSSAKLESLAHAQGWFYDAHRAEMDCHALLAVLATQLPKLSHTGLAHLLTAAKAPSFRVQATMAPFEAKDKLRTRGYRWNAEQRVWHTRIGDADSLQAEFAWLKENVYSGRSVKVQVEQLDALTKYSDRPGLITMQAI